MMLSVLGVVICALHLSAAAFVDSNAYGYSPPALPPTKAPTDKAPTRDVPTKAPVQALKTQRPYHVGPHGPPGTKIIYVCCGHCMYTARFIIHQLLHMHGLSQISRYE